MPGLLHSSIAVAAAALLVAAVGCEGPQGPDGGAGEQGPPGTPCWDLDGNGTADLDFEDTNDDGVVDVLDCLGIQGGDGEDGEDGEDAQPATFVGAAACADCHEDRVETYLRSAHPHAMPATGGGEPIEPWAGLGDFGEYPPSAPPGYGWEDVSYVLGGWAWKQHYVDADGYLLTGGEVQWNVDDGEWVEYEPGTPAGTVELQECAACHTTGYRLEGNQGGLPGIVGSWDGDGVQCEACHGNGSQHVADPYLVSMQIDRSAEACGRCHARGDVSELWAADGFVDHNAQWNELAHSKKKVLDCIDCHDPHASAHYADDDYNPDRGMRAVCTDCHFLEQDQQASAVMGAFLGCVDCHMPPATASAMGDPEAYTGDVRTHLFAIHPDPDAPQFSEDGSEAMPYLTLDYACRRCHRTGGMGFEYDDDTLAATARGYHDYTAP